MEFKVGDRVRYVVKKDIDNVKVGEVGIIRGISPHGSYAVDFEESGCKHSCEGLCQSNHGWWCSGYTLEMLEPANSIKDNIDALVSSYSNMKWQSRLWTERFHLKPLPNGTDLNNINGVSVHDLDYSALYRAQPITIQIDKAEDFDKEEFSRRLEEYFNKYMKRKEDKTMKFTFYVKEGTRIDKSCNKTVPTMTTFVSIGRYHSGKATCDKEDYDERQGCLEAIANAFLDGNFDREFNKAVKKNERTELRNRTCTYCGKVFDTVEELKEHEAWHVERKKARRERYLLRKRAKEIAFEEAAQKMAKEMIKEDK